MTRASARLELLSDAELVAVAQAGDRNGLDVLLRRHFDRLHAVCRRITGNEADAHDATQEALVSIAKGIRRFDGSSAFSTWAYRVATNASLDELRRRKRRPEPTVFADHPTSRGRTDATTRWTDPTTTAFMANEGLSLEDQTALRVDVDRALAAIPVDFRLAVVLRDLCGLDYAEIAQVLGVPGGTVRSRIARGRAALLPVLGNRTAVPQRPIPADSATEVSISPATPPTNPRPDHPPTTNE